MSQPPYIRPEFERELPPLRNLPVETLPFKPAPVESGMAA